MKTALENIINPAAKLVTDIYGIQILKLVHVQTNALTAAARKTLPVTKKNAPENIVKTDVNPAITGTQAPKPALITVKHKDTNMTKQIVRYPLITTATQIPVTTNIKIAYQKSMKTADLEISLRLKFPNILQKPKKNAPEM